MNTPTRVRRLFWDIETSPNLVLAFRAGYDVTINHDAVIQERKVICIGYKWEGEKKVTVLRWTKDQDDGPMLREFLETANEADELVAHFGDRFDMPWFRTRCLFHKLEPLPVYKTIDTKAWASKYFYFNSNKLDYIAKFLGVGEKLRTGFDLWKKILLDNCQKSLDYMCKYCEVDVITLESVYHRLNFCTKPKTHAAVFSGGEKWECAHCGSPRVRRQKRRVSSGGTTTHQMRCDSCGGYHTINDSTFIKFLENNRHDKKTHHPQAVRQTIIPKARRVR